MDEHEPEPNALVRRVQQTGILLYAAGETLQIHSSKTLRDLHLSSDRADPASLLMRKYSEFAARHPFEYTWLTGHLSDIAVGMFTSALTIELARRTEVTNRTLKNAFAFAPATLLSLYEILSEHPDPQDIACYAFGALVAYAAMYFPSRRTHGEI